MDIAATGGAGPSAVTTGYVADNGGEGFAAALGAGTTGLSVSSDAMAAASNGATEGSRAASATELPAVSMNMPLLANATAAQALPGEQTADGMALPPAAAAGADQPLADGQAPAALAEPAAAADCISQTDLDLPSVGEAQTVPLQPATPAASKPVPAAEDHKPAEPDPVEPAASELPREVVAVEFLVGVAQQATDETASSSGETSTADPETSDASDADPADASPAPAANASSWTPLVGAAQPVQAKMSKVDISEPKELASRGTRAAGQLSAEAGSGTPKSVKGASVPAAGQFAGMMPGAAPEQSPQADGAPAQPTTFLATGQQIGGAQQPSTPSPASAAANHVAMAFRPDKVAREMGLEIARRVSAGGDELLIRLDPAELGRINIRMSVNEQGHLRAVVAADAPAVLDAIRGDVSELNRALEQAGVRTDSQSFRFDRGGGGDQNGQWQQRYQKQNAGTDQGQTSSFAGNDGQPAYRSMATSGRVNMMA